MADRTETVAISKFDGKNFHQWKFQMQCALKAKGVYGYVNGNIQKPNETDANALASWEKMDATAMFLLTSAMDLIQITLIENCETSEEIMTKLKSIYEQKSETNKMIAQERFHEYKMNPNDTVAQHIAKIENLARDIKDCGDMVSDMSIITKIISTLPQKFRNLRQ